MCGIAGIVYKQTSGPTGDTLLKMLHGCQHRGPDSTGLALYGPVRQRQLILRLFLDADLTHNPDLWPQRQSRVEQVLAQHHFTQHTQWRQNAFARLSGSFGAAQQDEPDIQKLSYAIEEIQGVEIFSAGLSLEVIKDEGSADDIEQRYGCAAFTGTHGIGHVRLATESDVNPSTAHPFWAYGFHDIAIVHNGQITNYFKLRRRLEQRGYRFRTENDSEVIAVYLADKMKRGVSMADALEQSLGELDGTFSFLVSTPEGIGYAKDSIGAKPMVVYQTDEYVAVASEEVSLQWLCTDTGGKTIDSFEPYPGTSFTWFRSTPVDLVSAI